MTGWAGRVAAAPAPPPVIAPAPLTLASTAPPSVAPPASLDQTPLRMPPVAWTTDAREPNVSEVRIGYFGPAEPTHPDAGDLWVAASLAVAEANAAGGYRGLPFRLVSRWSDSPWRAGAAHVSQLAFEDRVWAIVGGPDGATTHLAEQVVAKAHVALVGAASTDPTVNQAGVGWIFSCAPSDEALAIPLAAAIRAELEGREAAAIHAPARPGLLVITGTDHDARVAWVELAKALHAAGVTPDGQMETPPGEPVPPAIIARAMGDERPGRDRLVLVVAAPRDSARVVLALRAAGHRGPLFGGASLGRRAFVEAAGVEAAGVVFPTGLDEGAARSPFAAAFAAQVGHTPDAAAVDTYDAVRLVVEAVRRAGLNRGRIVSELRGLSGWRGAGGVLEWDERGQNRRSPRMTGIP